MNDGRIIFERKNDDLRRTMTMMVMAGDEKGL